MGNVKKKNVHFYLNLYMFLYKRIDKGGIVLIIFAFSVSIRRTKINIPNFPF